MSTPFSGHGTASTAPRPVMALAGTAFYFSGVAALVYQVIWQRILALQSGMGIYSVAMIVAAFMAGLGLGSAVGGMACTRVTPRRALAVFALLELGIGVFGASSCALYYDWLYVRWWGLYESAAVAGMLHFAALLFPTALMGMSLPFLVRATVSEAPRAGQTVGYLYAINVLGAATGAVLTPWVLIPHLGMRGGVWVAAIANAVAGGVALLAWRSAAVEGERATPSAPDSAESERDGRPFGLWLALYALSGFTALSLEMLWFRIVDVVEKSTAFTFGTVLGVYLLGMGAGSLLAIPWVERTRRPLLTFLRCQCLLVGYSAAAVALLVAVLPETPFYRSFARRLGEIGPFVPNTGLELLLVYGALPLVLFGPPTVLMGFSFPILQRGVHDEALTSGRKVGFLQAANIAGCVLGSLLVALVSLRTIGTAGTLRCLLVLGLGFAAVGVYYYGLRKLWAPAAGLGFLLALVPSQDRLWHGLHALEGTDAIVEEDATGVVLINRPKNVWLFWSQGLRNSRLPYGGVHTVLGAVPALVHPKPEAVAIIGLGSGDTAWAAGCRRETSEVTVYEIVGPQLHALRRLSESQAIPELRSLLADERYAILTADGRNAVTHGPRLWDVIEIDALWPHSAYAGNLYSVEFLTRCARKLKRRGIMCSWAPTARIHATFRHAFPYVLDLSEGKILLGSNEPIALDVAAWKARLAEPAVQRYLGRARSLEVEGYLEGARPAAGPLMELNEDLFPRDEFGRGH